MNGFREFEVSEEAQRKAKELGMTGDIVDRLKTMSRRSAPMTHQHGNRRFDTYILKIVNGVLIDLHDTAFDKMRAQ